jgi:hypothetical protein
LILAAVAILVLTSVAAFAGEAGEPTASMPGGCHMRMQQGSAGSTDAGGEAAQGCPMMKKGDDKMGEGCPMMMKGGGEGGCKGMAMKGCDMMGEGCPMMMMKGGDEGRCKIMIIKSGEKMDEGCPMMMMMRPDGPGCCRSQMACGSRGEHGRKQACHGARSTKAHHKGSCGMTDESCKCKRGYATVTL